MQQFVQEHGVGIVLWLVVLFVVSGPSTKAALEKRQRIVLDRITDRPTRSLFGLVFGIWAFLYSGRGEYPGISIMELSVAVAGTCWFANLLYPFLEHWAETAGSLQKLGVVFGCAALPAILLMIFKIIRVEWRELSETENR